MAEKVLPPSRCCLWLLLMWLIVRAAAIYPCLHIEVGRAAVQDGNGFWKFPVTCFALGTVTVTGEHKPRLQTPQQGVTLNYTSSANSRFLFLLDDQSPLSGRYSCLFRETDCLNSSYSAYIEKETILSVVSETRLRQVQRMAQLCKVYLQRFPVTCQYAMLCQDELEGVSTVFASDRTWSFYCDQTTDGGGWTVIQRRQSGNENFFRGWDDYVNGFGFFRDEFWHGLEEIHQWTNNSKTTLRIDMWDFEGNTAYAQYDRFSLGGADDKYRLHISGYSGTAGESLAFHQNGMQFTTYDNDNDGTAGTNCAVDRHSGWWYNTSNHQPCAISDLNSRYMLSGANRTQGITWWYWKKAHIALKKTEMKIRPG